MTLASTDKSNTQVSFHKPGIISKPPMIKSYEIFKLSITNMNNTTYLGWSVSVA